MRINRYIARSGVTSRRKAEELLRLGKVSVNGKVITNLGTDINQTKDKVLVSGKAISLPDFKYFMLNKPVGYTTTREDINAKHIVFELLPKDKSLITVGRLDRDTSGLLLITNDGDFAQNIIHPSNKIEKEYAITTKRPLDNIMIDSLTRGVPLEDGMARAVNVKTHGNKELTVTILEGRKRIVRRMIKAIGSEVYALKRIRIGDIKLDTAVGAYRELTEKEILPYVK
jgi:23S rRNA pseudouridine2605 synthase